MNDLNPLSLYISSWAWQIISLNFFVGSAVIFVLSNKLLHYTVSVFMLLVFLFCQYMSRERKKEFYEQ